MSTGTWERVQARRPSCGATGHSPGWGRLRGAVAAQERWLRPPLPPGPGVCPVCRGPARPDYLHCFHCGLHAESAPGLLADAVLPVSYALKGGRLAHDLWIYKSALLWLRLATGRRRHADAPGRRAKHARAAGAASAPRTCGTCSRAAMGRLGPPRAARRTGPGRPRPEPGPLHRATAVTSRTCPAARRHLDHGVARPVRGGGAQAGRRRARRGRGGWQASGQAGRSDGTVRQAAAGPPLPRVGGGFTAVSRGLIRPVGGFRPPPGARPAKLSGQDGRFCTTVRGSERFSRVLCPRCCPSTHSWPVRDLRP